MLSLEEKLAIVASFPELQRKDVSLGRINFHYEDSVYDKKNVVYHLHPNGNGFVYAEFIKGYATDNKGLVNIRDFSAEELRSVIEKSIASLTGKASPKAAEPRSTEEVEEQWSDEEGHQLTVTFVEDLWYIYAGENLDCAFETYEEVEEYMNEEGFAKKL
ncbi:hypothetical protein GCM10008018_56070 [Paenibacillus marchantiophytorum]|uniref:Uncharacterized protein n=1 Tax=Paenibacillus marchantiophytorum TaxID=1619310 RepID=A0ABQ1F8M9_9BACL|nr:hypothetical protein [Paenibacillus marchantiophytorum]GGA02788.1 hypothetical protein GCM10008018_56070 [Paenibacillus marchantiophytorum]